MSSRSSFNRSKARRIARRVSQGPRTRRPRFETLEDRCLLSFTPVGPFGPGEWPYPPVPSPETPDLNNDGYGDGLWINPWDNNVSVALSDGQGDYGGALEYGVGEFPVSVAVGDFNEDTFLDLAVANQLSGDLTILMNDGEGRFDNSSKLSTFGNPGSVAVGDFNADGKLDLGIAAYAYGFIGYYGYATVHAGDGTGNFETLNPYGTLFTRFGSATAVDLDGDDADELIVANEWNAPTGGAVYIFRVDDSGFVQRSDVLFIDQDSLPYTFEVLNVQLGDLNGDGTLDIVTANGADTQNVSVFLSDGEGGYGAAQNYLNSSVFYYHLLLADFNRDGWLDIAADGWALINNGDWGPINSNPLPGDFDGDRVVDGRDFLAWQRNPSVGNLADWEAYYGQSASPDPVLSRMPLAVDDSDGESWFEISAVNTPENSVLVLNNAQTSVTLPQTVSVDSEDGTKVHGERTTTRLFTFWVPLSATHDHAVTVSHHTFEESATTSGGGYIANRGTSRYAPAETTKKFTIEVKGDNVNEADEFFNVDLFDLSSNSLFIKFRGVGTILNDDH